MKDDYLTTKEYWAEQTGAFTPFKVEDNPFAKRFEKYLPVNPDFTCVEIGAYPGANLCYLSKRFGYRPTAIEYRDDADDIRKLFEFNGIHNLEIINTDFCEVEDRQFDLVSSFGFIEHFADYGKVITKHIDMVKPGGFLVISVPHYWGLQAVMRNMIFKGEAVKQLVTTHNLKIMTLKNLEKSINSFNLEILYASYEMNAQFWISPESSLIRPNKKSLAQFFCLLNKVLLSHLPSCFLYSPMILLIAQKKHVRI